MFVLYFALFWKLKLFQNPSSTHFCLISFTYSDCEELSVCWFLGDSAFVCFKLRLFHNQFTVPCSSEVQPVNLLRTGFCFSTGMRVSIQPHHSVTVDVSSFPALLGTTVVQYITAIWRQYWSAFVYSPMLFFIKWRSWPVFSWSLVTSASLEPDFLDNNQFFE